MAYFFFKRRRRNTGYTERENGTALSERALSAEKCGKFTQGKFRTVYGVSRKDFDALVMIGVITTNEWHHTGKSFTKNDFFEWDDKDFLTIYNDHKSDVSKLSTQLASAAWQWQKHVVTSYVKPYERFVNDYIYDHKYDGILSRALAGLINAQESISEAGDTIGTSYERYLMHQQCEEYFKKQARNIIGEDTIRKAFNSEYGSRIEENEKIEARNSEIKSSNLSTPGKETILLNLASFFYDDDNMYDIVYEASQKEKAAEESRKQEAERKAREAELQALQAAADKKAADYLAKCIKSGKAAPFTRVDKSDLTDLCHITLEEMNGKYGWFKPKYDYNLPTYYTGYRFSDKRTLNHYKKLSTINQ